ncbi:MAG: hypothetical protein OXE94_00215 [Aestuariivita sp.]|nr:hypothetical protein [Aestuariivita sp.]MCY4202107.1 hypothetical protein [Aestuariivita sp.]MCY4288059.1 hypothetical protein [Aestuariivita sp.]MCY4345827.1 hypothetical protein [Aestuariivita sp.]
MNDFLITAKLELDIINEAQERAAFRMKISVKLGNDPCTLKT